MTKMVPRVEVRRNPKLSALDGRQIRTLCNDLLPSSIRYHLLLTLVPRTNKAVKRFLHVTEIFSPFDFQHRPCLRAPSVIRHGIKTFLIESGVELSDNSYTFALSIMMVQVESTVRQPAVPKSSLESLPGEILNLIWSLCLDNAEMVAINTTR